jgi:hypothetical protein
MRKNGQNLGFKGVDQDGKTQLENRGKKSGFLRAQNFIFLKNAKKLKNEKKA